MDGWLRSRSEEAHAVAEIEELGRGGIVRGADGGDAHFLENLELAFGGAGVERRAEGAEVVVLRDAVERNAFAVEEETTIGRELDAADAEGRLVGMFPWELPQGLTELLRRWGVEAKH